MTPNYQILLVTHVLALGLAYGVAKNTAADAGKTAVAPPVRSKSLARERQAASADGSQLLEGFLKEQSGGKSKYEELKATLPVAKDLKGAVVEAIASLTASGWPNGLTTDEAADRLAEVEVRVLHWMKRNPGEAMDFLLSDPASVDSNLPHALREHVFMEVASAAGLLKSLDWLTKSDETLPTLCAVALQEMKSGGGLALFAKLQVAMQGNPFQADYRKVVLDDKESSDRDPFAEGDEFLRGVGATVALNDKQKLLELAMSQPDVESRQLLLLGFAKSDGRATAWLLDLVARGELDGDLAANLKGTLGDAVLRTPSMDLDKRVEARRATQGNETKPRQDIVNELVRGDVGNLLEKGRDWRYEFRNGTASLDDVVSAVRAGLPGIPPEGEDAMRVKLYLELSEENPKKALAVLDDLPEEKRRDVLFNATWESQVNLSPDDFLRFLADVPEPVTPQEKDLRIKGWNWKARGFLTRYGDDYVQWVKEMPPGIDKDTAMNSLIWATREQNPAEARKLNDQLYPKNP